MTGSTTTAQYLRSTIKFSHGRNKYDNKPKQLEVANPDEFIEYISKPRATEKGMDYLASAFTPGRHDDPAKNPGTASFRLKRLAAPSRFLAFDIDAVSAPQIADALRQAMSEHRGIAYTTASHTDEQPRFRVILIVNREMTHAERIAASRTLEAKFVQTTSTLLGQTLSEEGIKFDPSVYRAEQPCYLPLVGARTKRLTGQEVDVDALLADHQSLPPSNNLLLTEYNLHRTPQPETAESIAQIQQALANIPAASDAGCDYECWRNILWALASTGFTCAKDIAKAWSQQSPEDFNEADFERTWASYNPAKHATISIGTLFHIAKQHGYLFPDARTPDNEHALTDTGNSRRFADTFAGRLRYVHGIGQWLYWSPNACRWVFCTMAQQIEFAKQFAEQMLKEAV